MLQNLFLEMEEFASIRRIPIIRANERDVFCRLIREANAHRILEVGTAIGYSTLLLAKESPKDVHITTVEKNKKRAEQARSFFRKSHYDSQIRLCVGDASSLLTTLDESYDLVFLDAAKGQYVDHLAKVLPHLASSGLILADNVLFRGYVFGNESVPRRFRTIAKRLRKYIKLVQEIPGFETDIIADGDGLAVTRWERKAFHAEETRTFSACRQF